jgi:glutamine amidotransferase
VRTRVAVVDYGLGNILSVTRALEFCGAEVVVTSDPDIILSADRLVLPGVGAFADGMKGMREAKLLEPVAEFAKTERPFLGICLGMQMLLATAEEFGHHEGMGIVPGSVRAIPGTTAEGKPHKIPHIGWNGLWSPQEWKSTILEGIPQGASVYFVHSFAADPTEAQCLLATADYNGRSITAVIRKGNTYGCQFHPEKSGEVGMQILRNFLKI